MDTPPLCIETPKEPQNDLSKLDNISHIIKDKNNNSFNITFYLKNNSIFIKGNEEGDIINSTFIKDIYLENFYELNRFFKSFETINEIFELIKEIEKEEFSIEKKDRRLELSFNIQIMKKNILISISLDKMKNNTESIVMNLCEKIKEIETLKTTIENLTLKINNLEKENSQLKLQVEKINSVLDDTINLRKKIPVGEIFESIDDFKLINEAIKSRFNKEIIKFNLLYKAIKNENIKQEFLARCLNINDTIIVIKTDTDRKFGGFVHEKWPSTQGDVGDEFAFLFSLNDKIIYEIKDCSKAISCSPSYFLKFGDLRSSDFALDNNCMNNESSYESKKGSSYDFKGKTHPLNQSQYFKVKEFEVYYLEFE